MSYQIRAFLNFYFKGDTPDVLKVFQAHPTGRRPRGRLEGLYLSAGLGTLREPPE